MPILEETLDYLGIDYVDDAVRRNAQMALDAAADVIRGAVGDDVYEMLPDSRKLKELTLLHTADLYDERNTTTPKANAVNRKIVDSMEWQLKLELRRKKEELV
ncbi:MAG: hypothetical protein K2J71_08910 [Oscillospiraceae bacterium]|nr:hypothetical protein [Oscillospiraceae bacterium]